MAQTIRIKRGSESKVKTLYENGVVPQGEPIYTVDTNHLFIGNGNNDKTALFSSNSFHVGEGSSNIKVNILVFNLSIICYSFLLIFY